MSGLQLRLKWSVERQAALFSAGQYVRAVINCSNGEWRKIKQMVMVDDDIDALQLCYTFIIILEYLTKSSFDRQIFK